MRLQCARADLRFIPIAMAAKRRQDPSAQSLVNAFLSLNPQARIAMLVVLVSVGAVVWYTQRQRYAGPGAPSGPSDNLLLGNPSGAPANPLDRNNYLMIKANYTLSYNESTGTPNWVSWRVAEGDLGEAPRKRAFDEDLELPMGFKRVLSHDYTSSGFDRGHMCPHSDRAANQEMSFSTFVMTNIIPQAPNVNEKAWAELEDYGRELVRKDHAHLYIIAGPAGKGGRGTAGYKELIGGNEGGRKVTVPAECWKVIVVVPEGGAADQSDLTKINSGTRVISVIMPNDEQKVTGYDWTPFRTSVAAVEQKTGLRFFDRLPPDLAAMLKQKVDTTFVPPPQPSEHSGSGGSSREQRRASWQKIRTNCWR